MKKVFNIVCLVWVLSLLFLGQTTVSAQNINGNTESYTSPTVYSQSKSVSVNAKQQSTKRTYVLVQGAFHGGWSWSKVAEILRSQGNVVFTPTFTGLGERSHLINPGIDLNTLINDVKGVIESEELQNVILVGHSFGGYVISGVIDQMGGRIAGAIYLDAPMGVNGESVFDGAPADVRKARTDAAIIVKGTKAIAPPSSKAFGLSNAAEVAWVDRRMTPMPFKCYETKLILKNKPGGNIPKLFVHSIKPVLSNIVPSANYAKKNGWGYIEISTGHDAMISKPEEVASILRSFADKLQT